MEDARLLGRLRVRLQQRIRPRGVVVTIGLGGGLRRGSWLGRRRELGRRRLLRGPWWCLLSSGLSQRLLRGGLGRRLLRRLGLGSRLGLGRSLWLGRRGRLGLGARLGRRTIRVRHLA